MEQTLSIDYKKLYLEEKIKKCDTLIEKIKKSYDNRIKHYKDLLENKNKNGFFSKETLISLQKEKDFKISEVEFYKELFIIKVNEN